MNKDQPSRKRSSSRAATDKIKASTKAADAPMSEQRAIQIAREAVVGLADIPDDVSPEVEKTHDMYQVTFPTHLSPDTLGADYHARVSIDSVSGKVTNILGGH